MQGLPIELGGFKGRTNKLVDGCYSWWVGGCVVLAETLLGVATHPDAPAEVQPEEADKDGEKSWEDVDGEPHPVNPSSIYADCPAFLTHRVPLQPLRAARIPSLRRPALSRRPARQAAQVSASHANRARHADITLDLPAC